MVKKHSIDDLARRISRRNVITKHSVLNESKLCGGFLELWNLTKQ